MKYTITYLVSIAITVFLGISSPVHASTITTLFNTGVDATGAVLSNNTIGDPHYSIISAPVGSATETRIITSEGGYPIVPYYIGDNTSSRWIGPDNDADLNGPIGTYTYRTTFDLTGFDSNTASITGQWSTDDGGLDILINGISSGYTNSSIPTSFSQFLITTGFVEGINTLDFLVGNDGSEANPTALRVELTGTASPVPVPAAVWLFGSGLLGLLKIRKRVTS